MSRRLGQSRGHVSFARSLGQSKSPEQARPKGHENRLHLSVGGGTRSRCRGASMWAEAPGEKPQTVLQTAHLIHIKIWNP